MRALALGLLVALLASPAAQADAGEAVAAEDPTAEPLPAETLPDAPPAETLSIGADEAFSCPPPCPGPVGGLADGCVLATGEDPGLRCGSGSIPCSILDEPVCWSVRMACYYVYGPLGRQGIECQTQPGCCNLTLAGDPGLAFAGPGVAWQPPDPADDTCANYGVQVIVSVGASRCDVCENHGVQVVVGDCGGTPARVCAGEACLIVDCGVRVEGLPPTGGPETPSADRGCA